MKTVGVCTDTIVIKGYPSGELEACTDAALEEKSAGVVGSKRIGV